MMRRLPLILAGTAAALFLVALRPAAARADFEVCNQSGEHISVAIAYHDKDSGNWVARGWWNLDDGECKTPVGGDLQDRYYYLYADGDQHTWTGSNQFCADNAHAFTLNDADTTCDYDMVNFFEVDTGELDSYTYTFR